MLAEPLDAKPTIWPLLLGLTLLMLGAGLQSSLLGLRATDAGFSTVQVGLVMASYYLGFILAARSVPGSLAAVGHIRVFTALAAIGSIAALLHAQLVHPWTWTALRLVTGMAIGGLLVVAESWLNDSVTNLNRGTMLSWYSVVLIGGFGAGQFLLNVADLDGNGLFILVSVLVSMAIVPVALTPMRAPVVGEWHSVPVRSIVQTTPLAAVGSVVIGLVGGMIYGMGAVYADAAGLDTAETARFMAVTILGAVVLQWPLGRASDRIDRRLVIGLAALASCGAALWGAAMTGRAGLGLLLAAGLFGGLSLSLYSLLVAHANDHLEGNRRLGAASTLVLLTGVGAIGGPVLATAVLLVDTAGFFVALAVLQAGLAATALTGMAVGATPLRPTRWMPVPPRATQFAAALANRAGRRPGRPSRPRARAKD